MEAEAVFTVQQVVAAAFMLYLCMFLYLLLPLFTFLLGLSSS